MPGGVRLKFSVFGDVQLDRTLARFSEAASDMRPAWEILRDRFLVLERRQFATEGGYGSGGWSPLSPTYAAWKARVAPGAKILHLTGELEDSLTQGPQIDIRTESIMILGSAVSHGEYHQRGDGVPQRRPVELRESERREWVKVMQRWIIGNGLGGATATNLRARPPAP